MKTVTWDLVAWNRAGAALFDFDTLVPENRNILRRIFTDPQSRAAQLDWESVARLKLTGEQNRELHEWLHGFLIFHLGKLPRGRNAAFH